MNRGEIRAMARALCPQAKKQAIGDTRMNAFIDQAQLRVAVDAAVIRTDETFNAVSGTSEYNLTTQLTNFLQIDDSGIWYRTSGTAEWDQLYPRTIAWLDDNMPTWRDMDDGTPKRYTIKRDTLITVPGCDTSVTDGFRAYFIQRPALMTTDAHFPFGGVTEVEQFTPFSMCLVRKVVHLCYQTLGKRELANNAKQEYDQEIQYVDSLVGRRRDIEANYRNAKLQGPLVGV